MKKLLFTRYLNNLISSCRLVHVLRNEVKHTQKKKCDKIEEEKKKFP